MSSFKSDDTDVTWDDVINGTIDKWDYNNQQGSVINDFYKNNQNQVYLSYSSPVRSYQGLVCEKIDDIYVRPVKATDKISWPIAYESQYVLGSYFQPCGEFTGTVIREDTKTPVANAEVRVFNTGAGLNTFTDELGNFNAYSPSSLSVNCVIFPPEGSGLQVKNMYDLQVDHGAVVDLGQIELEPMATITGSVTILDTNEPVEGASVWFGDDTEHKVFTGADGSYTLFANPGTNTLHMVPPSWTCLESQDIADVTVVSAGTTEVDVQTKEKSGAVDWTPMQVTNGLGEAINFYPVFNDPADIAGYKFAPYADGSDEFEVDSMYGLRDCLIGYESKVLYYKRVDANAKPLKCYTCILGEKLPYRNVYCHSQQEETHSTYSDYFIQYYLNYDIYTAGFGNLNDSYNAYGSFWDQGQGSNVIPTINDVIYSGDDTGFYEAFSDYFIQVWKYDIIASWGTYKEQEVDGSYYDATSVRWENTGFDDKSTFNFVLCHPFN